MEFEKRVQATLGELVFQIVQLQHENEFLRTQLEEALKGQINQEETKEPGR